MGEDDTRRKVGGNFCDGLFRAKILMLLFAVFAGLCLFAVQWRHRALFLYAPGTYDALDRVDKRLILAALVSFVLAAVAGVVHLG